MQRQLRRILVPLVAAALAVVLAALPAAAEKPVRCTGQTVYAPAYSHIYHGVKTRHFPLTVTLSIRNVDPANTITITAVEYRNEKGELLRTFSGIQRGLQPFETAEAVIEQQDASGGSGASFVVRWESSASAIPPMIQTVMIGSAAGQGISFLSGSRVIEQH
ncbi:Protein of unknown function DUF3124 [Desulfovibrio sp. X2]|uniref:DUF3124 domain-containing protein n=1 Tax=Desulfovibrio sp. X2 TaxID=941449 RepID=UPI000358B72E|nr:DUF3124 domain-containing protein [Desulfovibrio sp. X2]EPR43999.1 Protein of unknown function DUF3124 [Desulfovibrio sp. X2]